MQYIIDANNLAGQIGILKEENFDLILIELIKEFNIDKGRQIYLVFDSLDPVGDKYTEDNVTIIYTPRDGYYKNADDKIIELIEERTDNNKDEFLVISDDIEVKEKVQELADINYKVFIENASDFAERLDTFLNKVSPDFIEGNRELDEDEEGEITDEFMNLWSDSGEDDDEEENL